MGDRPEPFFPYCLESIHDAVDYLVLNDNSGNPSNPNLDYLKNSRIWKEERVKLLPGILSELGGFHGARNICLDETGRLGLDGNVWILYLDCDEVHPESLSTLTRKILPAAPSGIGVVEGYFFQFLQSFKYYGSIDHRHNLLFRYNPDIRWIEPIHSKLINIKGKPLVTPYVYFHYGYVYSPENLYKRFQLYHEYGALPDLAQDGDVIAEGLKTLIPTALRFIGKHPKAIRANIDSLTEEMKSYIDNFETAMKNYYASNKIKSWKPFLKSMNFYAKLMLRQIGSALKLFPHLSAFPLMGRLWEETF